MKFSIVSSLALASTAAASASWEAESTMDQLMSIKLQQREKFRSDGLFNIDTYKDLGSQECVDGKAGEFSCENVDLLSFLSHQSMGSSTREGNDVWGWTSADGREFGIVGQTDGTAFVEVLNDGSLEYIGRLPTQTVSSVWRDMKVIGDYVYIGSEAYGHGLQIFDLNKLLPLNSSDPTTFSTLFDLTAWYTGFGSSHNIVAHEDKNMIYAVGTTRGLSCGGGLWMVDVSDPANPTSPGCVNEDGYVHDAQCVTYKGPDRRYRNREICFNYNEDTLTIVDVTDKGNPVQLSKTSYAGFNYTHQGWIIDQHDMSYLLLDDELDEMNGKGPAVNGHTTTYIFDIKHLRKPKNTGVYQSPVKAIDHNQYVLEGLSYQSNYGSGLRIVDVRSVARDPTGGKFRQVGFFDCHPEDDAQGGAVEFVGSWSVYPYFKSGHILLNSIERGLFSLRYTG